MSIRTWEVDYDDRCGCYVMAGRQEPGTFVTHADHVAVVEEWNEKVLKAYADGYVHALRGAK